MLAFELRLQYACIATVEQRLSEQNSKGDLVHRALTIERLIAKLDYNFLRTEIPKRDKRGLVVTNTSKTISIIYKIIYTQPLEKYFFNHKCNLDRRICNYFYNKYLQ